MTLEIKIIMAVVLSAALALLTTCGVQHYNALQAKAALGDQRGGVLTAASGILQASDAGDVKRQQADTGIAQGRSTAQQQIAKVKNENPDIRVRSDRIFPDSLRSIAHQRRLARERLGRAGSGGQGEASGADAAER